MKLVQECLLKKYIQLFFQNYLFCLGWLKQILLKLKLLKKNRDILEAMKDALIEYETIDAEQVDDLMNRKKVRKPKDWDKPGPDSSSRKKPQNKKPDSDPSVGSVVEET